MGKHDPDKDFLSQAPLGLAHLLTVSGPVAEGTVALLELPDEYAPHVCRAIRGLLAWSRGPAASAELFDSDALPAWEAELARTRFDETVWNPVFVIAGELCRPQDLDLPLVAWSCLLLSEWADGLGAQGTAVELAQVAGTLWPEHPRYAWIIGKLLRSHSHLREAHLWFSRAVRAAAGARDLEVQAMALNSLGNLYILQGALDHARACLNRALKVAERGAVHDREAKVLHDLFMLSVMVGDHRAAEAFGIRAFERYGPAHSDLPKLAHDVAHLWSDQGHFGRALPVFLSLLPLFHEAGARLRVVASAARAAGGGGDETLFRKMWMEAQSLIEHERAAPVLAESLVELALGAASVGLWAEARDALAYVLDVSGSTGENETAARAERVMAAVRAEERADRSARRLGDRGEPVEVLARGFVKVLEAQFLAASLPAAGRRPGKEGP